MDCKKINHLLVSALLVFLSCTVNAQISAAEIQLIEADKQLFLKALKLSDKGKLKEAESVYRDLVKRNEDWPEPKNNLAIILLRTDRLKEAKQMLERAITSSPSYRVAQNNRTQLYNYLATQAYDKALGTDQQIPVPEMEVINEVQPSYKIVEKITEKTVEVVIEKPVEVIVEKPVIVERIVEKIVIEKPPVDESLTEPHALEASSVESKDTLRDSVINTQKKMENSVAKNSNSEVTNSIEQQLIGWSRAWSQGDFEFYIKAYSDKFTPSDDRKTFAEWKNIRRGRLVYAKGVNVSFDHLRVFVEPQGDFVLAEFIQHYESASYSDKVLKQMYMQKEQNSWRILSERTIKTY